MATRTLLIVGSVLFVSAAGGVELGREVKQAKRTLNDAYVAKDLKAVRQGTTAKHLSRRVKKLSRTITLTYFLSCETAVPRISAA